MTHSVFRSNLKVGDNIEIHQSTAGPIAGPTGGIVNPKHVQALKEGKIDYSVLPFDVIAELALAMMEGALKYGRFNFLEQPITSRTYIAAICRHLFGDPKNGTQGWVNGEDIDPDSGLHHLVKVMACCAVARAAERADMLIDDRLDTETITQDPPTSDEIRGPVADPLWDVVFIEAMEDGIQASRQVRGPYKSVAQAHDYIERNPEGLKGTPMVQLSRQKLRGNTNA